MGISGRVAKIFGILDTETVGILVAGFAVYRFDGAVALPEQSMSQSHPQMDNVRFRCNSEFLAKSGGQVFSRRIKCTGDVLVGKLGVTIMRADVLQRPVTQFVVMASVLDQQFMVLYQDPGKGQVDQSI